MTDTIDITKTQTHCRFCRTALTLMEQGGAECNRCWEVWSRVDTMPRDVLSLIISDYGIALRTRVVYTGDRPGAEETIAIVIDAEAPYVYCRHHPSDAPTKHASDMLVLPMYQAERLFDLQQAEAL